MIGKISHIFNRPFEHFEKVDFFRKVLYLFLLLNALLLLPIAQDLFGYHGLIGTRGWNTNLPLYRQGTHGLINILSHPGNGSYGWFYLVFVFGQITFLISGLLNFWPKISSFFVYFFTVNLFLKGYLAFTGGEVLVNFLLFYLMFIHKRKGEGPFSDLQNILNNTFYWILLIQICILYFFSAFYKMYDPNWTSGEAIMYISRIDNYSSAPFEWLFGDRLWLSMIATYLTLAYQILFPLLVWFKKVKTPFLIIGVVFHLGIAFGMGIFSFGIIMIIVYILFLDLKQIKRMKSYLKESKLKSLLKPFYGQKLNVED